MLTGFTTTIVGGRTQISQGNPDLKPERSTSVDAGLEWTSRGTRLDLTLFRTVVKDRFISNVVISNPPPPDPIVLSVANGLDAHLSGLELEVDHRFGAAIRPCSPTRPTTSIARSGWPPARSRTCSTCPRTRFAPGSTSTPGRSAAGCPLGRCVGRKDNDFNQPGFPDRRLRGLHRGRCLGVVADRPPPCRGPERGQPLRRVLLREDRVPAARRVLQGCLPGGLLMVWRSIGATLLLGCATAAAPHAEAPRANVTRGCVQAFDATADYFPDKVSLEDAVNFTVDLSPLLQGRDGPRRLRRGTAGDLRAGAVRGTAAGAGRSSGRRHRRHGAGDVALLGLDDAPAAAGRSRPSRRPDRRGAAERSRPATTSRRAAGPARSASSRRCRSSMRSWSSRAARSVHGRRDAGRVADRRARRRYPGRGQHRMARADGAGAGRVAQVHGAVPQRGAGRAAASTAR